MVEEVEYMIVEHFETGYYGLLRLDDSTVDFEDNFGETVDEILEKFVHEYGLSQVYIKKRV